MSNKHNVLFVCIHNSARSQMAEAFLKKYGGDTFAAESAGLEPGTLNPNVVEVMKEVGIDLTGKPTQAVFDLFQQGRLYNAVITVCDKEAAERCATSSLAWSSASQGPSKTPPPSKAVMRKSFKRPAKSATRLKRKSKTSPKKPGKSAIG